MADFIELINQKNSLSLGSKIKIASTFSQRFIGLLSRNSLIEGEGLLIERCNQVHMFFMRFEIGILFLDPAFNIVGIDLCLKPWNVAIAVQQAYYVLELPVGVIEKTECEYGDRIIRV